VSAILLVRLKITDLSAWTALETGRHLLDPGYALTRLVRERLLMFEPEAASRADSFERTLGEAVRHSNFFVNPNKESYRFWTVAERGETWSPPEGAWGILARPREDTRDERLRESLQREHPMPGLRAIRRARVWWLWTRGPDGGPSIPYFSGALGELEDQKHGLLVNPHAEASMILTDAVPWSRVERFLTEPPPALRAAA
jgi:hypothetical protein